MKYKINIGWLYQDLMNTYGDRGNIICLQKRCEWRGIDVQIENLDVGFDHKLLAKCNLLFMGGAQDRQQKIVMDDLNPPAGGKKAEVLKSEIEQGKVGLYVCGAYQFLGKYYKEADGTIIPGLGILDLFTENPGENHERLIGNVAVESSLCHPERSEGSYHKDSSSIKTQNDIMNLVGFENHGGRTYLGKNIEPFAKVIHGFGNNGNQPRLDEDHAGDKTEGAIYKNTFGTYLHGPILPKNPHFADYLISKALEMKYKKKIELSNLDDSLEHQAHDEILKKLRRSNSF